MPKEKEGMNNFISSPIVTLTTSIFLILAKITLWSATVIILTAVAVPSVIMWILGAYLTSYLALSTSGFKLMPKYLVPKSPGKLKRARMH